MKIKILPFIAMIVLLISCNNSGIFSKFDRFGEDNRWAQSDIKTYAFSIDNDTALYNVAFHFSHVYDYQFATVPIDFTFESPDGKKENISIDLAIKNDKGEQLADCSGDVCDLTYAIKAKTKLQKGNYKVTIANNFGGPYLPNVIGVGMEVEKVAR